MNIELRYINNIKHSTYQELDQKYNGIILDVIMNQFDVKKTPNEMLSPFLKYLKESPLYDDLELLQINIYNLMNDDIIKNVFRLICLLMSYYGFGITIYFGMNKESKKIVIRKLKNSYNNLLIASPFQDALDHNNARNNLQPKNIKTIKNLEDKIIRNVDYLYNKYKRIL